MVGIQKLDTWCNHSVSDSMVGITPTVYWVFKIKYDWNLASTALKSGGCHAGSPQAAVLTYTPDFDTHA